MTGAGDAGDEDVVLGDFAAVRVPNIAEQEPCFWMRLFPNVGVVVFEFGSGDEGEAGIGGEGAADCAAAGEQFENFERWF